MQKQPLWWSTATLLALLLLFVWHGILIRFGHASLLLLQISYGIGFSLIAALLMGALARWRFTPYPAFWRLLTMIVGAAAAAAEIGLHSYPPVYFYSLWAAALLGLSGFSLLTRYLPQRGLTVLFGQEESNEKI